MENWISENWEDTNEVRAARIWFETFFQNVPPGKYKIIYEFALSKWDALGHARERLEERADAMLKFVAALAAGVVAVLKISSGDNLVSRLIPSLVCFGLSAVMAIAVMRTTKWPHPMSVLEALQSCDVKDDEIAYGQLAASIHVALAGTRSLLQHKARILDGTHAFAIMGILLLSLVLL